MSPFVKHAATVLAVSTALLVALAGAWRELPLLSLAMRCLVAAALVWGFVRVGGELAGRSLLRGMAEAQLRREDERKEKAESQNPKSPAAAAARERKAA